MICFFFSSRRRHTRWPRDWSSDVCSSDLVLVHQVRDPVVDLTGLLRGQIESGASSPELSAPLGWVLPGGGLPDPFELPLPERAVQGCGGAEIGRAHV